MYRKGTLLIFALVITFDKCRSYYTDRCQYFLECDCVCDRIDDFPEARWPSDDQSYCVGRCGVALDLFSCSCSDWGMGQCCRGYKIANCENMDGQVCGLCEDNNVFYKNWNSGKTCERMCSFDAHTCWPGTCTDELTSGCNCTTGFHKVSDGSQTSCQLIMDNKPSINTCHTTISSVNGDAKQTVSGKCHEQDLYGNFQPAFIKFDMQATFILDITGVPRPKFIAEETFGITDATVYANSTSISGSSLQWARFNETTDDNLSTNAVSTFPSSKNYSLIGSNRTLNDGDKLCIIFEAIGGGYLKTNIFNNNTVGAPVPYHKTTARETICYRYDKSKPEHCISDKSCQTYINEPLQIEHKITRSSDIPIAFNGWKDPIPINGSEIHASGIESFEVTVHEVTNGSVDSKNVFGKKLNSNETFLTLNLTSDCPRLYCILLEVKDIADNVQLSRRFVLYDSTTNITVDQNKRFTVTSASDATGFTWQTHHNDICLDWKDYFINEFYSKNNLLGKINPDTTGHINGIYEQEDGPIPVSGTPNVHGITEFRFSWIINNSTSSPENVPNYLNQSFCKRLNLSDGETYKLIIEALDIVNNTYRENRTVHIDRTVPQINNMGLLKHGVKQLFVHDNTDLSKMNLSFEAFDHHSGILNIKWTFGISDSGHELGSGFIAASPIDQTSCPIHISSCYCPAVGKCERYSYSILLSKLIGNNTNVGNHNRNYYFTIKVTNNAMLYDIEHLDVLVDDSPPEPGVVYEGAVGSADIDYTRDSSFMVRWHGFIDHESGIREYRIGLADSCLNKNQLFPDIDGNISEYKTILYTETSVRLEANFTGKKYVNIVAINNAMESSKVVCSDGITRDVSPPGINNFKLQQGKWSESLFCLDGNAWLFKSEVTKVLLPSTEDCIKRCQVDSFGKELFDILPREYTANSDDIGQFLCTRASLYDKNTIIYLPHDHIAMSWNTDEYDSQIADTLVGFSSKSEYSADLLHVDFISTNKTSTFKKTHIGQGAGGLFFIYIKIVNKAGLQHIAKVGPILIDETPPYQKENPTVYIDNRFLIVGWNNDTFYDVEQTTPINQIFFQIAHEQQVITPLMEWMYEEVRCDSFSGGCFKYPLRNLQKADTDLGLNFSVKMYVYNNAGHFTQFETESFRIPSRYPPGHAIVRDIDPVMKVEPFLEDVNVHFTKHTVCIKWYGFKHHEHVKIEIGVGTSNDTDNIVPFQSTLETEMACINSIGLQQNVKYYVLLKASCSGGDTLSSSNGVTIVDAATYASFLELNVEPSDKDKSQYIFARTPINDTSVKVCSVSPLRTGQPYQLILPRQALRIVSDEVLHNATESWQTTFEIVPLVEHPCIIVNTNTSDNSPVKVVRLYDNIFCTNTESIRVSFRHLNGSNANIFYKIALLESPIGSSLTVSHFSRITDYERIYGVDEHVLSKVTLSPDMQYAVELLLCNNVRCLESVVNSRVYETEAYITIGVIEKSDIEVSGEKSCVDVHLRWQSFISKSGILLYQWAVTKDEEAYSILTPWKSLKGTSNLIIQVQECVNLPFLRHSTTFLCVRAFSRAGNTVTTCKKASTRVLTDIRVDTVYDVDASSDFWKVIQQAHDLVAKMF